MPVDIFGSGLCAVVLIFFAALAMIREINIFAYKYPPLHYAGDGTLMLLLLYLLRGLLVGIFVGAVSLWAAAYLAIESGVVA